MNLFAKYYDYLVGADYTQIINFLDSSIKQYKPDSELICDLGCGTCNVSVKLSDIGYDMIAIDSSDDMLSIAKKKVENTKSNSILLLCQDICNFELYGTVDVIYSTLDTLNYILFKRDLKRIFALVRNYLNYNGLFIFDINSHYKFTEILGNSTYIYDENDEFCVWESFFDRKTSYCSHSLTFFEKNNNGFYRRFNDYQEQRYYSQEYIEQLANKYGFDIIKVCDNYTNKKVTSKTERITYVLKVNK